MKYNHSAENSRYHRKLLNSEKTIISLLTTWVWDQMDTNPLATEQMIDRIGCHWTKNRSSIQKVLSPLLSIWLDKLKKTKCAYTATDIDVL